MKQKTAPKALGNEREHLNGLRALTITGTAISLAMISAAQYIYTHPQIVIGGIQKLIYKDGKPINSFEPFAAPKHTVKENGNLYITEISYGKDYPNSYLDITYPTEDISIQRPTVVYLHGGGFFGGDKVMGDPMAVDDDANRLFEEIVSRGYNFVNVNYALVPDCHFPVPLIQLSEALDYLKEHADELGLDMENVVLFGQSAGAILVGEYGALLTSSSYRELLGIVPGLTRKEIRSLVIDDCPYRTEAFGWKLRLMLGNYLGTMDRNGEEAKKFNPLPFLNESYPPSFFTAGNMDGFPKDMSFMSEALRKLGVETEYFFVDRKTAELYHGYLNTVKENPYARECFDRILAFMDRNTR